MFHLTLKPNKLRALLGGHPWVLDASLLPVAPEQTGSKNDSNDSNDSCDSNNSSACLSDGDVVDVYSDKGRFFARGFYNSRSKIRVRLFSWNEDEPLDQGFWERKIALALQLRQAIGYWTRPTESDVREFPDRNTEQPFDCCRLINSEGDGLSGLIVDQYGPILVVQVTSFGVFRNLDAIVPVLAQQTRCQSILIKTEENIARKEGIFLTEDQARDQNSRWYEGAVWGEPLPDRMVIDSGSILYKIELTGGQKTGFYLDQRENRNAAAQLLGGKTVLDMFCYHGGFSLAACKNGAVSALACDSSKKALDRTVENAKINNVDCLTTQQGDSFEILTAFKDQQKTFGGVILDPPKFATGKRTAQEALRGYHFLNRLGMSVVEPGGFLISCSCTGSVSREDFFDMLHGAAHQAGRTLQILQQRGAALDHPINAACPEGEYLKCFLCRVL